MVPVDEGFRLVANLRCAAQNPMVNLLAWKQMVRGKKGKKKAWCTLFFCLIWSIWALAREK